METLEDVLARFCEAEARGDAAALVALLAEEFRGDAPDGRVLCKQEWLERCAGGALRTGAFAWRCIEVRANHSTAAAIERCGAFARTLVAVRREGRWLIVNLQVGEIRPPRGRDIRHLADVPEAAVPDLAGMSHTNSKPQVIADMSMSLDGYVADTNDSINNLIGWMFAGGEEEIPTAIPGVAFKTSKPSAAVLRDAFQTVGALVSGRRNFELASGWGGTHPMGVPVFVVTHNPPEDWPHGDEGIKFVTDGVESAIAQAKEAAGDKIVGIATPSLVQQSLDAGLLDAIHVNLVPVLLGEGVPFFANLAKAPVRLEGPEVVEADGVTHLTYRVASEGRS